MNRLRGMRAYLCGAMGFTLDNGMAWRQMIGDHLRSDFDVTVLDPTNKPIDIGAETLENKEHRLSLKEAGAWDQINREMKIIRCVDLRMVDISDFSIVNVDISVYTVGTWEEVTLANRQKKPIIFHIEQGKRCCPDWVFGMVPHQFVMDEWSDVLEYLMHVDSDPLVEHMKRWYFFNFKGVK